MPTTSCGLLRLNCSARYHEELPERCGHDVPLDGGEKRSQPVVLNLYGRSRRSGSILSFDCICRRIRCRRPLLSQETNDDSRVGVIKDDLRVIHADSDCHAEAESRGGGM
jgi:hypothetical protein